MLKRETITVNDKLYYINYRLLEKHVESIDEMTNRYHATNAFRKDGYLYFCTEIEEAEVIEEIPWKTVIDEYFKTNTNEKHQIKKATKKTKVKPKSV